MNKVAILSSLLILLWVRTGESQSETRAQKYQGILDAATENGLSAITALVQSPNAEAWRGKSGVRSVELSSPLDIDASFRLASVTKIFTAIIILQLTDENKIRLDDNISQYLDTDTQSKISHIDEITILHLLSHSSGIYSFTENNDFWKEAFFEAGMSRTWEPQELVSYIENKKPVSKPLAPHSKKMYSNTNYILLGMIIENVTGNSLAHEYQSRFFTPLNMTRTFLEGYSAHDERAIDSYVIPKSHFVKSARSKLKLEKVRKDKLINLSAEYTLFNSWAWAAGGISSNVDDLSTFFAALRSGEIMSTESQAEFVKLYSAKAKDITYFGGTGGSDGIQATMLHVLPADVVIIILINSTGHKKVDLGSVFNELYAVASEQTD